MTQHTLHDEGQDDVATTPTTTDRWKALDFAAPRSDATEQSFEAQVAVK